jgi:hypothetical protein
MKIIDLIKKSLKEKGISEKHASRILKAYKVEKEEDVAAAIDSFAEDILPAITEAETAAKTAAEKSAKEAAIAEYEAAHKLKDGKPIEEHAPGAGDTKGLDPSVKALIEAQNKQLEEMKALIEGGQKKAGEEAKKTTAALLLKTAELPEGWLPRIDVNSETTIEDQVKALTEEYTGIQQKAIDARVASGDFRPGSFEVKDRSVEDWAKLMDSDVSQNNPGKVDLGLS